MNSKLRGKRTYILGAMAVLSALASWAVGDISLPEALRMIAEACLGLGLVTLRAGIKAVAPANPKPSLEPTALIERLEALPNSVSGSEALYQDGYLDAIAEAVELVKEHRG
jgi:hypothetical protein